MSPFPPPLPHPLFLPFPSFLTEWQCCYLVDFEGKAGQTLGLREYTKWDLCNAVVFKTKRLCVCVCACVCVCLCVCVCECVRGKNGVIG